MIFHLYLDFFIDHLFPLEIFQSRSQRNIVQQCTRLNLIICGWFNWKIRTKAAICYLIHNKLQNLIHHGVWCMVGFWHWHIPTFIITDISPPWWDFVMVGMCWVTMINPQILLPSAIFVDNIVMAMIKPSNIVAICYICWLQAPSIRTTKGAAHPSTPIRLAPL